MKRRKLILITADVILILVCIIQGVISGRDGVITFSCPSDIDEIVYESPSENFTLVRDGDAWLGGAKKYPVTKTSVDYFIEQISEIRALDKVGSLGNAAVAERYQLDDAHKITVTAKKDGKVLRTLHIGKEAPASSQSYIALDDKKDIFLASGNIRGTFSTSLSSIRSRAVWQLDKSAITGVTLRPASPGGNVLAITKTSSGEDSVWSISPSENQIDGAKAQAWFDSLANLTTPVWHDEDDLGGTKIVDAEIACGTDAITLSLYEIAPDGDGNATYYAKSSETPYVFELASYAAEKFLKTAEDFAE